jgi:hypothetical protein
MLREGQHSATIPSSHVHAGGYGQSLRRQAEIRSADLRSAMRECPAAAVEFSRPILKRRFSFCKVEDHCTNFFCDRTSAAATSSNWESYRARNAAIVHAPVIERHGPDRQSFKLFGDNDYANEKPAREEIAIIITMAS